MKVWHWLALGTVAAGGLAVGGMWLKRRKAAQTLGLSAGPMTLPVKGGVVGPGAIGVGKQVRVAGIVAPTSGTGADPMRLVYGLERQAARTTESIAPRSASAAEAAVHTVRNSADAQVAAAITSGAQSVVSFNNRSRLQFG